MFGKVMKQELRANSLLYGVASAIALLFAFATIMNRRAMVLDYLMQAPLLISGCTIAIVVLVLLFLQLCGIRKVCMETKGILHSVCLFPLWN